MMARCRRCGAVFDYDKRDGVCPGCCFYNRPDGKGSYDDAWLRSYNVEENTYVPPKVSWQDEEAGEGRGLFGKRNLIRDTPKKVRYSRAGDCRTEGSHVHRESGGQGKSQGKQAKAQKKKPSYIFLLIVIIYLLFTFFPELIRLIMELGSGLVNTL